MAPLTVPKAHALVPVKPPLQIPVLFGHWLVQGDKLVCRLPRKTVTVRAPRRLLAEVMELCDGSRAWTDVLQRLEQNWEDHTVASFMLRLTTEQLLVESGELWAHWSELAQLPQTTAVASNDAEIAQLHQQAEARLLPGEGVWHEQVRTRQNHLAATLEQRESFRTFDDQPLTLQTLCSVLWAAHGVVQPGDPGAVNWHRTVASGGNMHSARWFVAVLRELPSVDLGHAALPVGVYEARFHLDGGASLQPVIGSGHAAWTCLRDPRVLRYASALLLPIYDIAVPAHKYGNRATLFATLEAGQCLQNAQLMAASLGAACMLRGDTIAAEALSLAGLVDGEGAHWLSFPAMVLGVRPSPAQRLQQSTEYKFKVAPNLQLAGRAPRTQPQFAFAAAPTDIGNQLLAGSGRAADPRAAMNLAEAEAWERLGWVTLGKVTEARRGDVEHAVDPRRLVAYTGRQYRSPNFPFRRFDEAGLYLWSDAADIGTGQVHAVLTECVHALHALPERFRAQAYTSASTSGAAAGTSVEDAVMRATLELIERDAFSCAWLTGAALTAIETNSLPRDITQRLDALASAGLEITLLDVSTSWCPVIALFAQAAEMPFTAITAAAAFDVERALEKAVSEAEGRFTYAQHFPVNRAASSDPMRAIESYYRNPRTYRRSDFFRAVGSTRSIDAVGQGAARDWSELRSRIYADGFQVLAADITPPKAAIDQGRTPLYVVHAFVPGLVPIWFQRGLQPQGMQRFAKSAGVEGGRPAGHFIHPFT